MPPLKIKEILCPVCIDMEYTKFYCNLCQNTGKTNIYGIFDNYNNFYYIPKACLKCFDSKENQNCSVCGGKKYFYYRFNLEEDEKKYF
jgi:rRNA maturation endonuclease Nob1